MSYWRAPRVAVIIVVLVSLFGTTPALAAPDRTPPTTPTNLHTTASTANSVTLAWNPSTDNSGKVTYRVQMVSPSTEKVANQTSLTWNSLSPNSTYSFYVFKLVRIRKIVPVGEPTTGVGHLCAYGIYDRYGFLRCP